MAAPKPTRSIPHRAPAPQPEAPRRGVRNAATPGTPAPSDDLVWPPPAEELDALEMLHLGGPADAAGPHAVPATTRRAPAKHASMSWDDGTRLLRAAMHDRVVGILVLVLLIAIAMLIGAYLGERRARQAMLSKQEQPIAASQAPSSSSSSSSSSRADGTLASTPVPIGSAPPKLMKPPIARTAPARAVAVAATRTPPRSANARSVNARSVNARSANARSANADSRRVPDAPNPNPAGVALAPPALPEPRPITEQHDTLTAVRPVPSPTRSAEAAGIAGPAADIERARETVARYERAYEALDPRAAAAIWPSLDVAALTRAFETVKWQALTFDRCTFSVGDTTATVACAGTARVVPRIGTPRPIVESLRWTFRMRRHPGGWHIDSVETAR